MRPAHAVVKLPTFVGCVSAVRECAETERFCNNSISLCSARRATDGAIYYSDYARGYLGHLDLAIGKVQEWKSPGGAASQPYGIAVTRDGTVWYSESGVQSNTLVRFDPQTKQFSTTPIPSGGGVVRNMVATPDGHRLYLACSGVNKVAVVELPR